MACATLLVLVPACPDTEEDAEPTGALESTTGPSEASTGVAGSTGSASTSGTAGDEDTTTDASTTIVPGTGAETNGTGPTMDGDTTAGADTMATSGSTGGGSTTGEPVKACMPDGGDTECVQCLKQDCCEVYAACEANAECLCVLECHAEGEDITSCLASGCGFSGETLALQPCTAVDCRGAC